MKLFSIALVPEGNIVALARAARDAAFRAGDRSDAASFPEGIYLGFYEAGKDASEKALVRSFRRNALSLFEGLPPTLLFSACVRAGGRWYLSPERPLEPDIANAADNLALEAGFFRAGVAPLTPLAGFFAGNDVTPPAFGAFSFRHLDAALYKMEYSSGNFDALWWRCLGKAPRRVGPRRAARRPVAWRDSPCDVDGTDGPVVTGGDSMI